MKKYIISREVSESDLRGNNRKISVNRKKPQEKQLRLPVDVLRALKWINEHLVFDYKVEDRLLYICVRPVDSVPQWIGDEYICVDPEVGEDVLFGYQAGTLTEAQKQSFEKHLLLCWKCREVLEGKSGT